MPPAQNVFFKILSNLNQGGPNHLAGESQTCWPDTLPVLYPANTLDPCQVVISSRYHLVQVRQNLKKYRVAPQWGMRVVCKKPLRRLVVRIVDQWCLPSWREMPVITRQIGLRHDRKSIDKNQKKKKWCRPHTAFFTWIASFAKPTNDHVTDVFSFRFFLGRSVQATSWWKTPELTLTSCFSTSAQTSLKRSSERLLLFELSSSLSRIDDVFVTFGGKEKQQPAHCTETQRRRFIHTVAYDRAHTDGVSSQGRRYLELPRSVDCALAPRFLEPMHVYIHFQAYWACLVVIETNENPVQRHGMALRTLLGDRPRRKDDGSKRFFFFFAIAALPGAKVRTEGVHSLCFLSFSWFLSLTKP